MKGGRKESTKNTNREANVCMCVRVCDPSVINGAEADLRHSWGESHPSDSHPIRGAASSLCSWGTPARWNTGSRENMVYIHFYVLFMHLRHSKQGAGCGTYRVVECIHPGWPWRQTGTVKLPLMKNMRTISQLNLQLSEDFFLKHSNIYPFFVTFT